MSVNVGNFIGSWSVQWVSGAQPFLQSGWTIFIGTDTNGDRPPFLTGEYAIAVGFTVLNGQSKIALSTSPQISGEAPEEPLELLFVGDTLRWAGFYEQQPLHIYISLSMAQTAGEPYVSLYGSTTWGDPDQVGVWGADARPPGT